MKTRDQIQINLLNYMCTCKLNQSTSVEIRKITTGSLHLIY